MPYSGRRRLPVGTDAVRAGSAGASAGARMRRPTPAAPETPEARAHPRSPVSHPGRRHRPAARRGGAGCARVLRGRARCAGSGARAPRDRDRAVRAAAHPGTGSGAALAEARPERRSRAADGGHRSASPGSRHDLKAELQRVLIEAAANDKTLGESVPAAQSGAVRANRQGRGVTGWCTDLAKPYPGSPEAQFAVALAGYNTGLTDRRDRVARRCAAVDRALELKPGWDRAALLKADILAKGSPDNAIRFLTAFLATTPESRAAAGALAQLYVEQKRYARGARDLPAAARQRSRRSRVRVRRCGDIAADEGLRDREQRLLRSSKSAGYGEPGAVVVLPRARSPRRPSATTRRSPATARSPKAIAPGSRSCASRAMMAKKGDIDEARSYLAVARSPTTVEQESPAHAGRGAAACGTPGDYQGRVRGSDRGARRRDPIRSTCSTTSRWSPRSSIASTRSSRG